MPDFVHIDIAADNPERAARFYHEVFGWTVSKLEGPMPYWLLSTATDGKPGGIGAGIAKREQDWQRATPTIDVPSVEAFAERITEAGGTIVVPQTDIPGVGKLLTFKDPEGNVFAILEASRTNPFTGVAVGESL